MDLTEMVQPGMINEVVFVVEERHLAPHVGSGAARVLSTPSLIGFMEATSHRLLARVLPQGQSSVGVRVDMRHLAPTPLGDNVRVRTEVSAVEGNSVTFRVEAWDSSERIGECQHWRAVIDEARFLKRVQGKAVISDQ